MSEAVTTRPRSNAVTHRWHVAMKDAFGGGDAGADPAATAATQQPMSRDRLAVLHKTFDNVRGQSPEIAIRPLQDIAGEVAAEEFRIADTGAGVPRPLGAFKDQVMAEIEGCKARAIQVSADHVKGWQRRIGALPPVEAPVEDTKALALAIQKLVAEIESGIPRDEFMLRQVDPRASAGALSALNDITVAMVMLKSRYATMRPTEATVPSSLPDATRPEIGGSLTQAEKGELATAMEDTQGRMGKDEKADAATVEKAVALIAKGIDTESAQKSLLRLKTWDAVKGEYRQMLAEGRTDEAKKFMAGMWWFRRMVVDREMTELQKKHDFVWGSVGSDNPESDYDLTVRTHPATLVDGVRWDYQIVQIANKALTAPFGGKPPGIVFDTNLYAEAAPKELSEAEKANPATAAMGAMKEQGQDVGALMKLRRFMEWDEYEDYKAAMLKEVTDSRDRALVQRQFDEADSLFLIARAEQLREAAAQMPEGPERDARIKELDAVPDTPDGQRKLLALAAELEHHAADSMAANNAVYTKKLTEVRELEDKYNGTADATAKAALLARLKTLQADATFFAAEAYHSEGPLQHVVKAGQSSRLAINANGIDYTNNKAGKAAAINALKDEKLKDLSANQMLQSFNENLGDLLKDLRHYADEPFPGLGFYRSSKYVERLCDAFAVLSPKLPPKAKESFDALTFGDKAPKDVQVAVAALVDIRGEKTGYPPGLFADPEAEKQAFAIKQMQGIFPGVVTLPDLAKVATNFGQKVNGVVRTVITEQMRAASESPYFPK